MQTNVKNRISCSTDYLEYRQKIKNVFRYENKFFVIHSLVFSSNKRKGKSLREVVLFILKKAKKGEMGNPKEEVQCLFGKNKKTNKYFQNIKTTCIKVKITYSEAYLEPTQKSMMELFCENK